MKHKSLKQLIRLARDFTAAVHSGKPKVLLLAQEKRAYERELKAAGHSITEAKAMVSKRYSDSRQNPCARHSDVAQ